MADKCTAWPWPTALLLWGHHTSKSKGEINQSDLGCLSAKNRQVPSSHIEHPSGAAGVAYIRLLADASSLRVPATQLTTVIGNSPVQASETKVVWDLHTPNSQVVKLILDIPSSDEEARFLEEHGAAIYEVGITAQNREGAMKTPYGRLTFVPPLDAGP